MTAKEKAEELFVTYLEIVSATDGRYNIEGIAKQCALIAVDEIIGALHRTIPYSPAEYQWKEVRNEIEKL